MFKLVLSGMSIFGCAILAAGEKSAFQDCIERKQSQAPKGELPKSSPWSDCSKELNLGGQPAWRPNVQAVGQPGRGSSRQRRQRPPTVAAAPVTAPAPPGLLADSAIEQVRKGMETAEVRKLLGAPSYQIQGETLRMTYLLESGKKAKIEMGSKGVADVRIVD